MQKIFKNILVFLLCVVASVVCIPVRNVNGSTTNKVLCTIAYDNHVNYIYEYAYLNENNGRWVFVNSPIEHIATSENEDYPSDTLLIIEYFPVSYNGNFLWEIDSWTSNLTQINTSQVSLYNLGYQDGIQSTFGDHQEALDDAYQSGKIAGENEFAYGSVGYTAIYDSGYYDGYRDGESHPLNENGFYTMLKTVALYPVQIFTDGLNVDIFGVNVGGFLLGIGMLALVFFLLRKFLGR